ncbi:conserved protein of unknown function [Rhodovastum atsumiense]|uniref:Uncharacterized protein n=1 Tax=Rhodovastum atsumiense TaxID=504468 RepID=A0A5M6IJQ2_9PROT|nr:hypothetical protein [Rhodovastum atsumiense]KAA5608493.1 hypothetical protein F1189_28840 [Rhodovastum atsumiense]CAH2599291.1 conserved protein of unknown function [Rhodovastum atsumiense]
MDPNQTMPNATLHAVLEELEGMSHALLAVIQHLHERGQLDPGAVADKLDPQAPGTICCLLASWLRGLESQAAAARPGQAGTRPDGTGRSDA